MLGRVPKKNLANGKSGRAKRERFPLRDNRSGRKIELIDSFLKSPNSLIIVHPPCLALVEIKASAVAAHVKLKRIFQPLSTNLKYALGKENIESAVAAEQVLRKQFFSEIADMHFFD